MSIGLKHLGPHGYVGDRLRMNELDDEGRGDANEEPKTVRFVLGIPVHRHEQLVHFRTVDTVVSAYQDGLMNNDFGYVGKGAMCTEASHIYAAT